MLFFGKELGNILKPGVIIMEYFDILNKDGSKSGEIAPKGQQLSDGQYYNSKGEFLIQKRAETKDFLPGGWDIHMGHVMAGESSKTAIEREIHEELGIEVKRLKFIDRVIWEKYNHFIDIFAVCKDIDITNLKLEKSEVEDVKYISRADMIDLIRIMDYRPKEYRDIMERYVSGI